MKKSLMAAASAFALTLCLTACGGATDADADGDGTITQDEVNAAVADVQMNPGKWENTVTFNDIEFDASALPPEARGFIGPALEAMKGQVTTTESCVTPEEASRPQADMFSGNDDANCEYDKFEFSGGSIDMAMTCADPASGNAKITSTGTYTADAYDMVMTIALEGSEMGNMKISASSEGERIGGCEG